MLRNFKWHRIPEDSCATSQPHTFTPVSPQSETAPLLPLPVPSQPLDNNSGPPSDKQLSSLLSKPLWEHLPWHHVVPKTNNCSVVHWSPCLSHYIQRPKCNQFSSVQSLSHVLLFATPWIAARQAACPSPTPRVHPNSRPSSWWCHPAISSSVLPFSSCPQSLTGSESFPMS